MSDSTLNIIEIVLSGLVAIGTLLIAVLAVFGERLRRWIYRPKVEVEILTTSPFVIDFAEQQEEGGQPNKYVRISLRVNNIGSTTLKACCGLVEEVHIKRQSSEEYCLFKRIMPTQFVWDNTETKKNVIPEISSYLEVARIQMAGDLVSDEPLSGTPAPTNSELFLAIGSPENQSQLFKLGIGTFIVPIIICADNLNKAEKHYLKIYWTGKDHGSYSKSDFDVKLLPENELPDILETEL